MNSNSLKKNQPVLIFCLILCYGNVIGNVIALKVIKNHGETLLGLEPFLCGML